MKKTRLIVTAIAVAGLLAGCAETRTTSTSYRDYRPQGQAYPGSQMGYVERIEVVPKEGGSGVAGTVIGGIVGGLIGNQIGSGTGQTAATIAGAAGGAVAGSALERRRGSDETFRVTVRLDRGGYATIVQDDITNLRTGDRVRLEGDRLYRS